jgi:hypothetical protein
MNLIEVDKPEVKKTVVIYSGRFQPFHKGHYASYVKLVSKFGAENVYIGTSNDQSGPKSPFSFKEKKEIATKMFGIPSSKFLQIRNPYQPVEILKKFDGQTTQYIAAVGEKDATRLQGKYFKPYKGKSGYGYDEIGYVYAVPAEQNPISGTDVRKWLGATDKEKAKKGFLKAYPKFDKEVFKMITGKINENFIKGYPSKEDVKTIQSKNDKFRNTATTDDAYVYDPISELIGRVAAEEIFNDFLAEYLGEAPNKALDQDITYTNTKGQQKKIKARDALRLPKEHPAHIQAKKIAGPDDSPVNEPKAKEEPGKAAQAAAKPAQPGQPVKKDQTAQGKTDKAAPPTDGEQGPPPEQKLSGAELKSSAETSPKEKAATEREEKVKQALDNARKDLSEEDNQTIDKVNNPDSPERKGMMDNVKNGLKKFGKGIMAWGKHQAADIGGTMSAVKDLATTGKLGAVKDKEGKNRHWSEFTSVGRGGGPEWEEVEVDVTDHHGHPTGKKKTENRPKISDYASDEEKELFNQSWEKSKKQKKSCKNVAITTGLLLGSMALGGAGVAAIKAVAAGSGAGAVGAAAGSGAAGAFTHGAAGFGIHLAKDIGKHATLEAMGMGASTAAGAGAALSTATLGILENVNGGNNKFLINVIKKAAEKMEKYKLSDEQLLKSIENYKKNKPKQDAADLLRENLSETKNKSIQHFVEFATKRLKLQETPKVNLVGGGEFAEIKTSLGGFDPETKEIFVATEGRLTADILRTLAHEMVHRKQDEMGLVRNPMKDGADGSPIENQAHAVAGILMREYGRINKQIYQEQFSKAVKDFTNHHSDDMGTDAELDTYDFDDDRESEVGHQSNAKDFQNKGYELAKEDINIDVDKGDEVLMGKFKNKKVVVKDLGKDGHGMPTINGKVATTFRMGQKGQNIYEMGNKDVHFINVIKLYRNSTFRKRINAYLFGRANMPANPNMVARALRNMGYDEITQMEKELNIQPDLNEVSNVTITNTADVPDGSFIQKNKKRKLNTDKSEDWFKNGGYTQTDFPKADAIFGDEDAEERLVTYSIENLPDVDYVKTDFIKEGLLLEGGAYGHMSHPFDDMDLTFGDLKNIITGALNGDLGVVREKTDGQALAISWKNGRLIAARNKGHLENSGVRAMGIEDVASKFAGRGGLTDAYNFAMRDLSAAIGALSEAQRKKIFNEGKCFMNLEVIWPQSVNVIPYGQALLIFHNTTCYDEKGSAIGADQGASSTLAGMIKQINADVQSKYTIQGPPVTEIPKSDDLSSKQGKYISKLKKLQSEFGLNDNDTVALYHQSWWENFIDKKAPLKVDKLTKEALVRRWAFGDKGFRLNTISNLKLQEWAIQNDKVNVVKQQKDNVKPFEEIFLGVGADVLDFVSSVLTVHPEKAIRSMKSKFKSVADQVRTGGDVSKIQKLKSELKRLNQLGGIERIVATEGLVFFYNGKTYKLTGTFAPLNQILGLFY